MTVRHVQLITNVVERQVLLKFQQPKYRLFTSIQIRLQSSKNLQASVSSCPPINYHWIVKHCNHFWHCSCKNFKNCVVAGVTLRHSIIGCLLFFFNDEIRTNITIACSLKIMASGNIV